MQRTEAEPANRQYLSGQAGPVKLKRRSTGHARLDPLRAEQADRFILEAAHREPDRRHGRRIQPLHVVDDHQHRRRSRQRQQRVPDGRRDHPRLGRHRRRVLDQQRHPERSPLRRREPGENRIKPSAEQVSKTRERQPHLALRRHRPQHRVPQPGGPLQARLQQRRLSHPGRAGQHQSSRPGRQPGEERLNHAQFALAADHGLRHGSRIRARR